MGANASPAAGAGRAAPDDVGGGRFVAAPLTSAEAPISVPKSSSGQIAESDPGLVARSDSAPVRVMVKLDLDAAASYAGGVQDLAPTSPSVTGRPFRATDGAVREYLAYARGETTKAKAAIAEQVPAAVVDGSFEVVYGGLAVTVPADQAKHLLAVPGVVAVQLDSLAQPLSTPNAVVDGVVDPDTTSFIGADAVWPSLGGRDHAGQGVIVGVLDSGIWPEHPMLADPGLPAPAGGPWACEFGDGDDPALGAAFACNNKLVGAYSFLDTALATGSAVPGEYCNLGTGDCTARDANGHGTHTATTAAGSYVEHAEILGADLGAISGVAPGASVIAYRVCTESGCYGSDSVAAVAQAIVDGVDVINFSISGGANAYSDPVELAFLDAYRAGISVNASAGNEGPGAGTANHAGPWVTTVAASTSDRSFASTLTLTAPGGEQYDKAGATITAGVTDRPVVLASSLPGYDELCSTPLDPATVTDAVVVCARGGNARVDKGYNVLQGGAAGMILSNPTVSDVETDNHWLPAIHLEGPNDELLAFLAEHPGATASWAAGSAAVDTADVMAGFSSRGPLGDFLKPDVTAPGVQVLAGNTPTPLSTSAGPAGQLYQAIAGTSMASPHAAGVSALVRAAHPDWTPGQVKSALMTSSLQAVTNADGSPAGVWDRGAGSIRADLAVSPVVTFDVPSEDYLASTADELHRADLNLPSLNVAPLPGAATFERTAVNVSGVEQHLDVQANGADGLEISVEPASVTLAPGESATLRILVDGTAASEGWHTGQVTVLPSAGNRAVLPVAARVGDGVVTLAQTCEATTILQHEGTTCDATATNLAAVPVDVTIDASASGAVQLTSPGTGDSAQLQPADGSDGGTLTTTLAPAAAPVVTGLVPATGESPGGGYLPLSGFGQPYETGFTDDSVVNYTLDTPFRYGDELYSRIGVTSNGTLIVGGGTAVDATAETQALPNPLAPNNVLAPYWTDLNPEQGGGIRVTTLTDTVDTWLVVDFDRVQVYRESGASPIQRQTFEVWIQLGDTEGIWYVYGSVGGDISYAPLVVGAENRDGTSGVVLGQVPSTGSEYAVTTLGPQPGGSTTLSYGVTGHQGGTGWAVATLSTSVMRSPAVARTEITVEAVDEPEPTSPPTAPGEPEPTVDPTAPGEPEPTVQPTAPGEPEPTVQPTASGDPEPTVQPTQPGVAEGEGGGGQPPAQAAASDHKPLAQTGSWLLPLALVAVALLGVGGISVVTAVRQSTRQDV